MDKIKVFAFREGIRLPLHGSDHAAGFDLYSPEEYILRAQTQLIISVGIGFEIPVGWYGQIHGRSSLNKRGLLAMPGVIDSDYRGEIKVGLFNLNEYTPTHNNDVVINKYDRIAQIIFTPCWSESIEITTIEAVTSTERGSQGFGSTGT